MERHSQNSEGITRAGATRRTERWGSRAGVILAVAGSAVGLGNFLRFPGQAAEYGGGAFMIAYFVALLVIGLPICWAEWTMGRRAGQAGMHSSPGIFHFFVRNRFGKYLGVIGVTVPVVIYMYYVVIEAWCLGYAVHFLKGGLGFSTPAEAGAFFGKFVGASADGSALGFGLGTVFWFLVAAFALNFFLIYRGLFKGIEWFCKYAMPMLVVLALVVLVRVLTLGTPDPAQPQNSVNSGLGFMWNPTKVFLDARGQDGEWERSLELVGASAIASAEQQVAAAPEEFRIRQVGVLQQLLRPQLWLAASGQIFFSLSVGFGIILTYASYLRRSDDVVLSGLAATSANELCEVGLGGLITLPASVAFLGIGTVATMSSTFGLGFHALPMVFSQMPLGHLFGFLFFFLLFLAAVTSSLSMLQPGVAFLEETLRVGRKSSVAILGFITAVGAGFVVYFSKDLKALDTLDFWVGTFLIFVLATIQVVVFSWVWGAERGIADANQGSDLQLPRLVTWVLRYVSPVFLLGIFFLWLVENVFGVSFEDGSTGVSSYVKDLFFAPNLVAWLSVGFVLLLMAAILFLVASSKTFRQPPSSSLLE